MKYIVRSEDGREDIACFAKLSIAISFAKWISSGDEIVPCGVSVNRCNGINDYTVIANYAYGEEKEEK